MLGAALVGLQPAKDKVFRGGDAFRQFHRIRSRLHTAPGGPDIDLHQHRHADASIRGGSLNRGDLAGIVRAHRDLGDTGQRAQARKLGGANDFVADQDVGNAAPGQHLGFGYLLHAVAHRAARHLHLGDDR